MIWEKSALWEAIRLKRGLKIGLSLAAGFAAAMILMSVAIYFGYSRAYRAEAEAYTVKLLGISIYELTRVGSRYAGAAVGPHMGMICGICMAVSLAGGRAMSRFRRR